MLISAVLGSAALTACGQLACPAVGSISTVTLHVTPQRAADLATLTTEFCQDGACRSVALSPAELTTAIPGYVPPPTPPTAPRALPRRQADGSLDITIEIPINDHALDVTTNGSDSQGGPLGTSHLQLRPVTTYPYGRECGGPTAASATLDPGGLRAG